MTQYKNANNPWQEHFMFSFEDPGVAPVAATGLITCVTNANMADSDFITISDGFTVQKYEYDKSANGVTSGRVNWAAGASSAADVAATLKTAINATQPGILVTDNLDGTLTLAMRWPGAGGNNTITENVANSGFLVAGFTGGVDASSHNATYAKKLFTAQRVLRIEKIEYINPTGLAQDASNYWTIAVKKGSTVIAQWSTLTTAQGTLTADAVNNLALSATDANLVAAVGDVISFALTKTASAANLPAGRIHVHGRYVS